MALKTACSLASQKALSPLNVYGCKVIVGECGVIWAEQAPTIGKAFSQIQFSKKTRTGIKNVELHPLIYIV